MIRRKKTTSAEGAEPAAAVAEAGAEAGAGSTPPASESSGQKNRFRSWVTDTAKGYERLTDEQARQIVLKFSGKPEGEVLTMLKDAGFRFQPEYFGQRKVWTRRNDFEGRMRLEEIEAAVRGTGAEVSPN